MKTFKYETHLHTKQGSACGRHTGADIVDYYESLGYSGFIVTDHFDGGHTAINFNLPWEQAIGNFFIGYEDAKKRGDEIGFDVFFGLEYGFHGTEFLIYGLDKEKLLAMPRLIKMDLKAALGYFKRAGAFIVHAHPFREASYIDEIRLCPELTDAVEIFNDKNTPAQNEKARLYAAKHSLPGIGGGDFHYKNDGESGIEVCRRAQSYSELLEVIRSGDFSIIKSS